MSWVTPVCTAGFCPVESRRHPVASSGTIDHVNPPMDPAAGDEGTAPRRTLDESVVVARAQNGDPRAFETLVRRHQNAMYGVALRILANPDDAEDVTQNAFVTAWRRLPEFRADSKFSTWMYRIVSNLALNAARDRGRRAESTDDIESAGEHGQWLQSEPADPEQKAQQSALMDAVRAALDGLHPDLKLCWLLREVERCSYQEVAEITGVGLDTARGRIYRARLQLAEAMSSWR